MLDGASKYLNNLLLARGFLQEGKPIDFARLAGANEQSSTRTSATVQPFDHCATTTVIINLIHDLILRRDRDAEKHEGLATTIRTLRAEESQRLLDFQKLQDKNIQLCNDLSTAEAQQRNLTIYAKRAQAEAKDLKEQNLKMKSMLDQVRAKCINDVRKRDVELEKLKNHINGLNRGRKEAAAGGMKINTLNLNTKPSKMVGREFRGGVEVNVTDKATMEWTLENETNDFLAAVVNETSTENVALRKIVGDSLNYLRTLTGLDEHEREQELAQSESIAYGKPIGIPGQYRDHHHTDNPAAARSDSLTPVQDLALSMSKVLSHCQCILRDPSFVPIEEVHIRDGEIEKLRDGWEKMADRWKEAVTMMSQWRQKMIGDAQDLNEQRRTIDDAFNAEGLSGIAAFGRSVAVRPNGQPILDSVEEEELTSMLIDHHSRIMANQSAMSIELDKQQQPHKREEPAINDESVLEPEGQGTPRQNSFLINADSNEPISNAVETNFSVAKPQIAASPARRGITLQKTTTINPQAAKAQARPPLSNANANSKKRKSPYSAAALLSPRKRRSISPPLPPSSEPSSTVNGSLLSAQDSFASESIDPLQINSDTENEDENEDEGDIDLFLPYSDCTTSSLSKLPRMTVAQKLATVEAEATEATEVIRIRQATTYSAADRRAKDRVRKSKVVPSSGGSEKSLVEQSGSGRKTEQKRSDGGGNDTTAARDKLKRARDRRRSTLTPGELGALMRR